MTSSDLPHAASGNPGGGTSRRLTPQLALALAGAFLLGACLCGATGLALGGLAGQFRSPDGRDGIHRRGEVDPGYWPYPVLPLPATPSPVAPAPPATPSPAAPDPSVSPTPTG